MSISSPLPFERRACRKLPSFERAVKANTTKSNDPNTVITAGLSGFGAPRSQAGVETWYGWMHFNNPVESGFVLLPVIYGVSKISGASYGGGAWNKYFKAWLMTTDWNPATLTWNTQPAFAGESIRHDATGNSAHSPNVAPFFNLTQAKIPLVVEVRERAYGVAIECGTTMGGEWRVVASGGYCGWLPAAK